MIRKLRKRLIIPVTDRSFNRSVVLLTSHDIDGSVGFIFNKPLDLCISDLIPEIDSDIPVYNGGPVAKDNLYFVHNIPNLIPTSQKISEDLYWGGDFNILKQLLINNKLKNKDIRFFLGYYCNKAILLDEKYAAAYLNRGIAREMLRKDDEACSDWNKAASLGLKNGKSFAQQTCN